MDNNSRKPTVPHFELAFLLVIQLALYVAYFYFCQLPQSAYFAPVIAVEFVKRPLPMILFILYLFAGGLIFRKSTWSAIDSGQSVRFFVTAVSATIMWQFATYDFNLYYNHAHYFDRILIIVLAVLVYWHPFFVPLLTAVAIAIASQLHYPLPEAAWLWPDKQILFDALILFTAYFLLAVFRRTTPQVFLYLALCLTGAIYFHAGLAKLSIGPEYHSWLMDNKLSNLFVSSYITGWFGFLDKETIVYIARHLEAVNFPIALTTLLIELSGVAILWSKTVARFVLCAFVLLHIAIGLASGIFFWMWCLYDLSLLISIYKTEQSNDGAIFSPKLFILSIAIIVFSNIYFRPIHFAWFDTKVSNLFTIYGTGSSGNVYELEPHFFSPYDITFCQSRFYYLLNKKVLVGTYGTTQNYSLARKLDIANPSELEALKNEYGTNFYDERLVGQFATFMKQHVANSQKRRSKFIFLNSFAPPYHFGSSAAQHGYKFQEPLSSIQIYYEEHFYTGDTIMRIRKERVLDIPID